MKNYNEEYEEFYEDGSELFDTEQSNVIGVAESILEELNLTNPKDQIVRQEKTDSAGYVLGSRIIELAGYYIENLELHTIANSLELVLSIRDIYADKIEIIHFQCDYTAFVVMLINADAIGYIKRIVLGVNRCS